MQVRIWRIGHIVVNHNINPFNIDSPAQHIGRNANPLIKILEGFVPRDSLFLGKATVDRDGWEVTLAEETVEFAGSANGFDKDDDLVEFEGIEEVVEFAVLLGFSEADEELLKAVQSQLGLVVDVNLERLRVRRVCEKGPTFCMNFLQMGRISWERVAENIMTCLCFGVALKTSWISLLMSTS